jgi:cytochrome c oxidase subunit 2
MFFLICICVLVLVLMAEILSDFWLTFNYPINLQELNSRELILEGASFTHSSRLEVFWITLPSLVLFLIAFPSLDLLYTFDEIYGWSVCLKAIGHQWYWSYELTGLLKVR